MTTVKGVVQLAAKLLGVQDAVDSYLKGSVTDSIKRIVEGLVCCFNTVENEVAVDYVPILCEEQVESVDGFVEYAALSRPVAYVVSICGEGGKEVDAKCLATNISVAVGTYTVRYAVVPSEKGFEDDSEYGVGVFERLLAYGVAAEYCLHKGMYEEAAVWEKKYRMAIEAAAQQEQKAVERAEKARSEALETVKEAERLAKEQAEEEERLEAERLAKEKAEEEARLAETETAKRLADYKTIKARDWI